MDLKHPTATESAISGTKVTANLESLLVRLVKERVREETHPRVAS